VKVLLIGEHDKGLGEPFPISTLSGRRLRSIIAKYCVSATIVNMMDSNSSAPDEKDLERLAGYLDSHQTVIMLGRTVERQLRRYFPDALYLPHPAARRAIDRAALEEGLAFLGGEKLASGACGGK